jgi:O-antigen/teichoic acid export membrane protein
MSSLARRLLFAAGWQLAGNASRMALGLVASVLFVRWLGADQYGQAAWFLSLTLYINILVSAGLGTPLTRRLAICRTRGDRAGMLHLLRRLLALRALSLVPAALMLLAAAAWLPASTGPRVLMWYVLALLAVSFVNASMVRSLQGCFRQDVLALLTTAEVVVKLGLVWWWGQGTATAATLLGAGAVAEGISTIVAAWFLARSLPKGATAPGAETREDAPGLRTLLREGRPTWLLSLAERILGREIDVLIIGLLASPAQVTVYTLGYTVANLGISLTTSAAESTTNLTAFTEAGTAGAGTPRRLLRAMTEFWLLLVVPAAVGGAVVGPRVLHTFYGSAAEGAGLVCAILFAALALMALAAIGRDALLGAGRDRRAVMVFGAGGAVNLALSLLLTRPLGALGPALGTLAGAIVTTALIFGREISPAALWRWRRPLLVSAAALGGLVVAAKLTAELGPGTMALLATVAAGAGAYVLLLALLKPRTSLRPVACAWRGPAAMLRVIL